MNVNDCRLIIFAKAPVPGRVKTRLIPRIGSSAAAALYGQLILRTLSIASDAQIGPVDLWCAPSAEHPFFLRCAERLPISLFNQTDGDLGSRMANAFRETFKETSLALLIGTDCPSLTPDDLREGVEVLRRGTAAVIAPSEDGGYVLIGLRRYAPELFEDISWGTGSVLRQTRERLHGLAWTWHELSWQWDVDRPEDMERLDREGNFTRP